MLTFQAGQQTTQMLHIVPWSMTNEKTRKGMDAIIPSSNLETCCEPYVDCLVLKPRP